MKYIYIVFYVYSGKKGSGHGHVDFTLDHRLIDSTEIIKLLQNLKMKQFRRGFDIDSIAATGFQLLRKEKS